MDASKPWDIIGWGIIGYVVLLVAVIVIAILWIFAKSWWDVRRNKRANQGKLKCETKGCQNKAAYRTPLGLFCVEDSKNNAQKKGLYATVSFRFPLEYMRNTNQ